MRLLMLSSLRYTQEKTISSFVSTEKQICGPSRFLPFSKILSCCALVKDKIKLDYGYDSVILVIQLSPNIV